MTHPLNHPKNFCTLLSSSLRSLRSLRLIPNHSKNLCTLLSAATAFWKRHFFMPPQQTPALTTMQYPPSNFRGRSRRRQSAHFLAAGRPAPTHAGGYFLALLFALSALLAPASAFAQDATNSTATVTTDQSDYPPGSTVYITGAGFTPGEIVTNQVLHIPDTGDNNTSPAHDPWTVTADDAQFILIEGDIPGRDEIAGVVGGDGPGIVGGAGVVVTGVGDIEDLVGDDFAGGEAGAGDVHGAAGGVIGLVGGDGGSRISGVLGEGAGWRKQSAKSKEQSEEVAAGVGRRWSPGSQEVRRLTSAATPAEIGWWILHGG